MTLIAITADGQLTATIDGETVTLDPGQRWLNVVGADLKNDTFDGHYAITASVTKYGWHERTRIQRPTHFIWLPLQQRPARWRIIGMTEYQRLTGRKV